MLNFRLVDYSGCVDWFGFRNKYPVYKHEQFADVVVRIGDVDVLVMHATRSDKHIVVMCFVFNHLSAVFVVDGRDDSGLPLGLAEMAKLAVQAYETVKPCWPSWVDLTPVQRTVMSDLVKSMGASNAVETYTKRPESWCNMAGIKKSLPCTFSVLKSIIENP